MTEFHIDNDVISRRIDTLEKMASVAKPKTCTHGAYSNAAGVLKKFINGFYTSLEGVHKDIARIERYRDDIIASKKQNVDEYNEKLSAVKIEQRVNEAPPDKLEDIEIVPQAMLAELNWAITLPKKTKKEKSK